MNPAPAQAPRPGSKAADGVVKGRCRDCSSFNASPAELERAFPGLASMGSGYGAVRGNDGLCAMHGRYLSGLSSCGSFSRR
jgi:hypothetical protein